MEVLSETRSVEDNTGAYDERGRKSRYFVNNLIIIHLFFPEIIEENEKIRTFSAVAALVVRGNAKLKLLHSVRKQNASPLTLRYPNLSNIRLALCAP